MNNKMMFLEGKIEKFIKILNGYRYKNIFKDFKIEYCPGENYNAENCKEIQIGDRWGGYDVYGWVKIDVDLPESMLGSDQVLGHFDFGLTGAGNNSAFEAQCYIDDKIYQGVDTNHKEVFLPKNLKKFELKLKLWAGLNGGASEQESKSINLLHEVKKAEFAVLDKNVDDLYYLSVAVLQTLKRMDKNEKTYFMLSEAIGEIYNRIKLSDEKEIRESAKAMYEDLVKKMENIPDLKDVIIRCIGHTHIDVAWLWRLKHTREKAMRSFSTVMRLMEKYPKYIFFQSQPQLYQYIKEDAPELYEEIKNKVKEGKWEANGAMWVEADCNLTSGESLVRQLLYGRKFFKEEFGVTSNCLWLPDVFGYSGALPQILKKSGINTFMTTKISWNQYNRIPNDTFKWKGIDGTEILTHFVTTPVDAASDWWFYTYNGEIDSASVNGIWEGYKNKDLNNELILSYGFGDGGGGVNRNMLEMIDKLSLVPGNPEIITGTAYEYFEKLHEKTEDKKLNIWDGELYLEYHRGTYTSQAKTKKYNRELEYLLRNSEIISSLYEKDSYPRDFYEKEWKKVLTNQFHDILPGSSINEVYKDAEQTYAEIKESLNENLMKTIEKNSDKNQENIWTAFNFTNFAKKENIFIQTEKSFEFKDSEENILKKQKIVDGYLVEIEIESLGSKKIFGIPVVEEKKNPGTAAITEIENSKYSIKWDKEGRITSLWDKEQRREMIIPGKLGNELVIFEDMPRLFDAWELEPYYEDKKYPVNNLISVELMEDGELEKIVKFQWIYNQSKIVQKMILRECSKRIDFETYVDWKERNQILRTYFPVNVRTNKATYDIQFGNLERPTHKNTEWDFAKFEVSAHKWGDISQRGSGLALLNNCKYGYNAKESTIGLSLLKSAEAPDKTADLGEHTFTYSVISHKGDWYEGEVEKEAQFLNNPIAVFKGLLEEKRSFEISSENIVLDAVKISEDGKGYIIRMHEYGGRESETEILPNLDFISWTETDLMEIPEEEEKKEKIVLKFKPYEIKTIKLNI